VSPLRSGHDHINSAAVALTAHQPLVPVRNCRLGTVPLGHRGVGFDLMMAIKTPHDQPHMGRRGSSGSSRGARIPARMTGMFSEIPTGWSGST
jgi:hypothetical protein